MGHEMGGSAVRVRLPLVAALGGLLLGASEDGACVAENCTPSEVQNGSAPLYGWPSMRGHQIPGMYGRSPLAGASLLSPAWSWSWPGQHGSMSAVFTGGVLIDDQSYIYATSSEGIHKLSPSMELLWYYRAPVFATPVIHDGILYGGTHHGLAIALTMDIGRTVWSTKVSESVGGESKAVGLQDNVMVLSSHGNHEGGGDSGVTAINASTGSIIWTFAPDSQLWGFVPLFTGEGDVIFQDQVGGVYRLELATGRLIWKAGYMSEWDIPWTEGACTLGPNGLVYAVHAYCTTGWCDTAATGDIRAYRISTGELVWEQRTRTPAMTQPLVADLGWGTDRKLSVVVASGGKPDPPALIAEIHNGLWFASLYWREATWNFWNSLGRMRRWVCRMTERRGQVAAFDAETGDLQWSWEAPPLVGTGAGEDRAFWKRAAGIGGEWLCSPGLWTNPSLDGGGNIYLGHASGMIYELRDKNGNGVIDGDWEVNSRDVGFAFPRPGASIGDGMLLISSCDAVHAFLLGT